MATTVLIIGDSRLRGLSSLLMDVIVEQGSQSVDPFIRVQAWHSSGNIPHLCERFFLKEMGRSRSRSRSPRRERIMVRAGRSRSRERERRRERPIVRDPHRERADRERERVEREHGRERGRERSPSPTAAGRWPRGRSPPGRRRSTSRSSSPEPVKRSVRNETTERKEIDESQLVGKTEEEIELMKQMGFCHFNTTKNKNVQKNNTYIAHIMRKRRYRQYMNRRGGFNRPLDFIA